MFRKPQPWGLHGEFRLAAAEGLFDLPAVHVGVDHFPCQGAVCHGQVGQQVQGVDLVVLVPDDDHIQLNVR
ncbi:MAG: hypothetical protein R2825_15715 [Saprospiraceae bacterium]